MAEQGFILDIDTKFIQRLEQADKSLAKMVESVDKVSSRLNHLADGPLTKFASMIGSITGSVEKLSSTKVGDLGLTETSNIASTTIDKVNKIVESFDKIVVGDKSYNNGALVRINEQIDETRTKLASVQEQLKFYTEGEGQKAVGFIDLDGLQEKARDLISQLNKLRHERDAIIKDSKEKISLLPKQEELDKAWKLMEEERDHRKREEARLANETAKNNIEARRREVSESEKMYKRLFDLVDKRKNNKDVGNVDAKRIREVREAIEKANSAAEKWANTMKNVLGIHAIRAYANKLMSVRGEFELQQRSLQAILRNKREANELWGQTVELAVRSPFQVKELVRYTKQLAAYRVEAGKLNQTTKMLADISAGLGVEMDRLILAFGQVKAANYLRGTELRQFSEAGINILDELARYYTAMEGKAVTVGQVFDRVSKRMVSFADVEAVLQSVTSAGGMFYNMQEIQAETLKGSISNLKDQIDLMLNEIGEKNEGILKFGVSVVKTLVENYELLIPVLSMATAGFIAMQLAILKAKIGGEALAAGMLKMRKVVLHPWALAILAITEAAAAIVKYRHELKQIEKDHRMTMDTLDTMSLAMNDAFDNDDIKGARKALLDLMSVAKNDFSIDLGLSEEDLEKIDLSTIKTKFNQLQSEINDANLLSTAIDRAFASYTGFLGKGTGFGQAVRTMLGDYSSGVAFGGDIEGRVERYESVANELLRKIRSISASVSNVFGLTEDHPLRAVQEKTESDLDYLNRLIKAWNAIDVDKLLKERPELTSAVNEINRLKISFGTTFDALYTQFGSFFGSQVSEMAYDWTDKAVEGALNAFVNGKRWNDFTRQLIFKSQSLDFVPTQNTDVNGSNLGDDKKARDTRWQDLLRTIKEVNKAYKDLNKTFDETTARQGVMEKYSDALNDVLGKLLIDGKRLTATEFMSMFDLTNEEGFKAALDMIAKDAPDAADKLKAKLEKGEITWEAKIKTKEESDKELIQDIEDLFSGYELSIELDKLNVPKDFAKSLFGIEAFSLPEVREKVEAREGEFVGTAQEGKYKDFLKKLSDLEAKEQQKRLEKYLVYARNAVGERAKIKLEEMKKLQEIELAFAPKAGESAIDRDIRETDKQSAIEGVQSDAYQAERKLEWEEFQKSDTFISIFQDLDMASGTLINHALTKLREFRDSWTDMPHEEMKSIVENIEKLELKLVDMSNPFKAYKELRNELKGVGSIEELQADNILQEEKILALDKELAVSEQVLSLREEGKDIEADMLAFERDRADLFGLTAKETKDIVDSQKNQQKEAKKQISTNNANLTKIKATKEELLKQADTIQEIQKMANDLYDAFKELNEVVGDDDGPAAVFAEMGMSMANSVMNCLALQAQLKAAKEGADAFGKAMNTAMGIIGWIVMAVQLIASVLKAAFAAHDNALEKQIKRIQERVEVLQKQWEKLEEAMDEAFSVQQIDAYSEAAKRNMEDQISSYEQMIALEEDKKKTDHEKIKEWREDMEDLKEEYAELLEEGFSIATSGILDDTLGVARDFVDAWYDAFQETGNGLEGLKSNFQEMLKELISQQAALQIVGPYVDMYKDWLKRYIDIEGGDSTLTIDEAREWAQRVQSTFPEISALLENFFMGAEDLLQEQGGLSELSKGIQGVTESTAQIIEALLNSMRFYVADSNYRLQNIEAAFASSDVSRNPILNELQQHTQLIRSIESMFDSVIGRGSSVHSGAYLKVLM